MRKNGEGSVRQLSNGKWECIIQSKYTNPDSNTAQNANVINTALMAGHTAIRTENIYTHQTLDSMKSIQKPSEVVLKLDENNNDDENSMQNLESLLKEALADGVKAAEKGVEYTKTIIATKGRASYLGERSLGHQDPGATSFTTMLMVVAEKM